MKLENVLKLENALKKVLNIVHAGVVYFVYFLVVSVLWYIPSFGQPLYGVELGEPKFTFRDFFDIILLFLPIPLVFLIGIITCFKKKTVPWLTILYWVVGIIIICLFIYILFFSNITT